MAAMCLLEEASLMIEALCCCCPNLQLATMPMGTAN